jgi:hypothetical protein
MTFGSNGPTVYTTSLEKDVLFLSGESLDSMIHNCHIRESYYVATKYDMSGMYDPTL